MTTIGISVTPDRPDGRLTVHLPHPEDGVCAETEIGWRQALALSLAIAASAHVAAHRASVGPDEWAAALAGAEAEANRLLNDYYHHPKGES